MNKIKSAVISVLFGLAALALLLLAVISCDVPGSNHVKRYNSILQSITLSSSFGGEAYSVLYPEGVISASKYYAGIPEEEGEDKEEYIASYTQRGSVFVKTDKLEGEGKEDEFKASVLRDAEILSARFGQKGYSSYSVTVEDGFAIRVTVPTGFTYSAYKKLDNTSRSNQLSLISNTVNSLSREGELSVRTSDKSLTKNLSGSVTANGKKYYKLTNVKESASDVFKSFTKYSMGGNHAVRVNLTKEGKQRINEISTAVSGSSSDKALSFFVGENLIVSLTLQEALTGSFFINTNGNKSVAEDYAIVMQSAISGETLTNAYNKDVSTEVVVGTASLGDNAALMLVIAIALIFVAAAVLSIIKYKKLGAVNAFIILLYALVAIYAPYFLAIEISVASAITILLGLLLLTGCNFYLFETVRKETYSGKIIQAAVKSAYKKTVSTFLDMHLILLVASIFFAFVGVAEVASCGVMMLVATVASYILIWFTRFAWYVVSSPVGDKFAFGGYKRQVNDNED